jgi:hypothetical protein
MPINSCGLRTTLLAVVLGVIPAGCTSIRSTLFTYDGCQDCEKVKTHLKGVPTTLDVPTHLQVTVLRTRYGKLDNGVVTFAFPELETREVVVDQKTQKEIFTVDFKRPASGTLKYTATFTGQYITGVANHLEDTTIKDSAALVASIINAIPRATVKEKPADGGLAPFQDVIATELFALNEPDIENRIQSFLHTYVNQCHALCPSCTYSAPAPPCQGGCASAPEHQQSRLDATPAMVGALKAVPGPGQARQEMP